MSGIQVTDQAILAAGVPLAPAVFPGLVGRHSKLAQSLDLEAQAQRLLALYGAQARSHEGVLPPQPSEEALLEALAEFIRGVCQWGKRPKTAERVLRGNPWPELQRRFERAIDALAGDAPNLQFALRQLVKIRYLGVSFASKHLRLLRPDLCPVLDSLLSQKLGYPLKARGYRRFARDCRRVAQALERHRVKNPVPRPDGTWFAADVEMALYVYVTETR